MATITNIVKGKFRTSANIDGIQFNSITHTGNGASLQHILKGNTWQTSAENATDIKYAVNGVDIDWNGAQIDENTIINTTGELLSWIKNKCNQINSVDSEKINEIQNTIELYQEVFDSLLNNLLSKKYANENFQEKGDYITLDQYNFLLSKIENIENIINNDNKLTYYLAQTDKDTITIADFNRTGYKPTTIECFDATGSNNLVTTLVYPESWGEPSSMISDSSGEECIDAWKQNMTHGDSEFLHIPNGYIGTYIRTFADSTFTVTW